MNLAIDIGNSFSKCALFSEGNIKEIFTFKNCSEKELDTLFSQSVNIERCIISSTRNDSEITPLLSKRQSKLIILDRKTKLPIENLYKTPETLGKDRIAGAVGATLVNPNTNKLIIDAGTAITIDFVNDKNQYLGGNISPGIKIRFKALHNYTANLPLLEISENFDLLGNTSQSAIISGVLNGVLFEIDEYINRMKQQFSDLSVIITGGNADFFDKKLKNSIFVEQNLVLKGLNKILEYNA